MPDSEGCKTICIIGAGAAGLAALCAIKQSAEYKTGLWKTTVFEERHQVGGIWLPDSDADSTNESQLPMTPLYDSLTTNLPHPVMCFQNFPFPPSTPIFPEAAHVQRYLELYTRHFKLGSFIQFNKTVTSVVRNSLNLKWLVRLHSGESYDFDFVVIANGHHRIPRYPNIPGLESWLTSKRAMHSVWYRHRKYLGNKVLVVGGGPSGNDISAEMRGACTTLIRSISGAPCEDSGNLKIRGRLTKLGADGQAFFEDGSVESDIDYCILATGYQVSCPFLSPPLLLEGLPPRSPPLPETLHNSTYHLFPLARHVFPMQSHFPPRSLVFMGLPVRVAPLPIMEAQAAAIVHAFAYPESFDVERETKDLLTRYEERSATVNGDAAAMARSWSVFTEPEQWAYQDELYEFAQQDIRVPQWRQDMYAAKVLLRNFWVHLENTGEAVDWVNGVGEGGMDEWAALMEKLLAAARKWEFDTQSSSNQMETQATISV